MILFDLTNSENNPVYQALQIENNVRQYDFLRSTIMASLATNKQFLSQHLIKALNYHAITCLQVSAGEYRPCEVEVGPHRPLQFYRVPGLMEAFVNEKNRAWAETDPVYLATYVLWRLNNIHPFINGNGRTARAACYFVLCVKLGGWLRGTTILPELIKRERNPYCAALQLGHDTFSATGTADLSALHEIVSNLLTEQMSSVPLDPGTDAGVATAPIPATLG
jgi:Fic family protein